MLEDLLEKERAAVLKKWFDLIMETYPVDARKFLKQEKDSFANPVGSTISREIEVIFSELVRGLNPQDLASCLDNIIRIRAVQEFSPSQAVGFIFLLKQAIREELGEKIRQNRLLEDLLKFESRVDDLALLGFEVFMGCREKIYEIRANEIKNRSSILLKRMSQGRKGQDRERDLKDGIISAGNNEER